MKRATSFAEVLEAADRLSLDEQEMIIDILHRRWVESRRKQLAKEIQRAQREFQEGHCQPATSSDIVKGLLS